MVEKKGGVGAGENYFFQVYHLGTVAFGSLILAVIRMIRTVLEYVEKKCKMVNNDLTK